MRRAQFFAYLSYVPFTGLFCVEAIGRDCVLQLTRTEAIRRAQLYAFILYVRVIELAMLVGYRARLDAAIEMYIENRKNSALFTCTLPTRYEFAVLTGCR